MTREEFAKHRFSAATTVRYQGKVYEVYSVDFEEDLIAIDEYGTDGEILAWKRCENCEIVNP